MRKLLSFPWFKPEPFLIRSEWEVEAPVSEVRAIVEEPLLIKDWWPAVFMDVQEINAGLESGDGYTVKCFTKGFLPHSFQFVATIKSLTSDKLIIVTQGDFEGKGTIEIAEKSNVTSVNVEWQVSVHQPYIKSLLRILKPIFVWNHLWAMRQGRIGLEKFLRQRQQAHHVKAIRRPTFPHNMPGFRRPAKWRV